MTVEQRSVVDIMGVDKNTGEVVLTICDHLDWSDPSEHLHLLQEKINCFLAFVESGRIIESYPDGADRPIIINAVFKYKPNRSAREFLHRAGQIVETAGLTLRHEVFAESWDNQIS